MACVSVDSDRVDLTCHYLGLWVWTLWATQYTQSNYGELYVAVIWSRQPSWFQTSWI